MLPYLILFHVIIQVTKNLMIIAISDAPIQNATVLIQHTKTWKVNMILTL